MNRKYIHLLSLIGASLATLLPAVALAADIVAPNPLGVSSLLGPSGLIFKLLEWAIIIAGVIAVIYIIVGGYQYMTGGEDGIKRGRVTITAAIVGLVIVLIAALLVNTVQDILGAKQIDLQSSGGGSLSSIENRAIGIVFEDDDETELDTSSGGGDEPVRQDPGSSGSGVPI